MINLGPGKIFRRLTNPHELFYIGIPDVGSWLPIFSITYFRHKEYGGVTRYAKQYQTSSGIDIGRTKNYNAMQFYNKFTQSVYTTWDYNMDPGHHTNTQFRLTYDGGILLGP